MKNFFTLKRLMFMVFLFAFSYTVISCNNDDDQDKVELADTPEYYGSATNHYGEKPDSTVVRQDAVGKWYNENNELLIDIKSGYKNPDFPFTMVNNVRKNHLYYAFDLTSKVDVYPLVNPTKVESSIYKNNIGLGGMFYLVVEGSNGWLWIIRNSPQRIRVKKG